MPIRPPQDAVCGAPNAPGGTRQPIDDWTLTITDETLDRRADLGERLREIIQRSIHVTAHRDEARRQIELAGRTRDPAVLPLLHNLHIGARPTLVVPPIAAAELDRLLPGPLADYNIVRSDYVPPDQILVLLPGAEFAFPTFEPPADFWRYPAPPPTLHDFRRAAEGIAGESEREIELDGRAYIVLPTTSPDERPHDLAPDVCWRCDDRNGTTDVGLCDPCHADLVEP